jgi:hypothetical protein
MRGDERLRVLEREMASDPNDPRARGAWLAERLRHGLVRVEAVRLAGMLGDRGSRLALGGTGPWCAAAWDCRCVKVPDDQMAVRFDAQTILRPMGPAHHHHDEKCVETDPPPAQFREAIRAYKENMTLRACLLGTRLVLEKFPSPRFGYFREIAVVGIRMAQAYLDLPSGENYTAWNRWYADTARHANLIQHSPDNHTWIVGVHAGPVCLASQEGLLGYREFRNALKDHLVPLLLR